MNQSETLLEIKDLCVEFKTMAGTVHAVDHLSYTLHRGEKLGIVGESGSGKSVSSLAMMQLETDFVLVEPEADEAGDSTEVEENPTGTSRASS